MSQTNVIILRIDRKRTKEFEALFEAEQYPHWQELHAKKRFLAASLTRIEFGSEPDDARKGRYVNYVVVAKVRDIQAHEEHDEDPRSKEYPKREFQPEGPSVYGGTTIFEIGDGA